MIEIKVNKELLFVGGDISGIQKFIYNISSQKAMVSLKGRSAFLCKYTQQLCRGILDLAPVKCATFAEQIYCSGGKFYLIIEDSPEIRAAVEEYYRSEESRLWREQNGQLGLAIAYIPFLMLDNGGILANDMEYRQIGALWMLISAQFVKLKNQRFKKLLINDYNSLFEPIPAGGDIQVCAVTGIESKECVKLADDADGDGLWVLPSVKEHIERGQQLRNEEHFKTLEEYADGAFLGVLRMDVDGLGNRFIKGFETFNDYSAFSCKLSKFFEDKLKEVQSVYCKHLNIVYAGGDDLFAVGRWDVMIDFAEAVHSHFERYMDGEDVTISGGLAIVNPKFPISKAAQMSGEAEDDAKHYRDGRKNAFCFFGRSVSWDDEFAWVKRKKDEFVYQIQHNSIPRSILHQMMRYSKAALTGKNFSYKWHETYYLTRMIERTAETNLQAHDYLKQLRQESILRSRDDYRLLSLAARWAELYLRNNND